MEQQLGVFDYTNTQYHASEGLSRSKLWQFKQLPYKFWYEYMSGEYERPLDTESFILGDLVHTLTLEPHEFDSRYFLMPNIDRRTKQGKELYAGFLLESEGKVLIKYEHYEAAQTMTGSLRLNSHVIDLLHDAKMEKSIYWKHEPTGLICKARPDVWQGRIVSDLKTTLDAGFRGFQSSAYKYGYYLQAAMIYEALKSIGEPFETFVFIVIEKSKPYAVALYVLDDEALQYGIDMFHALMSQIANCYVTNNWAGYGVKNLTLPPYAKVENDFE